MQKQVLGLLCRVLEGLLSKHEYKMQTLRDLQTSLNQRGDI